MGRKRASVVAWLVALVACGGKAGSHGVAGGSAGAGMAMAPMTSTAGGSAPGEPVARGGAGALEPSAGEPSAVAGASSLEGGAGGAAPEPIPTFCDEQSHLFCADFDQAVYDAVWDDKVEEDGGSVAPSTAQAVSMPRALLAQVARQAFVGRARAVLRVAFPPGAKGFALGFDVFVDRVVRDPNLEESELGLFRVENGDSSVGLSLSFGEYGDRLWWRTSNGDSGFHFGSVPFHAWVHVEIVVTYATLGEGTYVVRLGDAAPSTWMNTNIGPNPGTIVLNVGLETDYGTADASALYDNVTFDVVNK